MRIYVLGSGSSGNCVVLESEGERLLIDGGIGPIRATERMRALGADLVSSSRAPLGLFVTHEHGDHAAHAGPLARALRAPLYLHSGVAVDRTHTSRFVPPVGGNPGFVPPAGGNPGFVPPVGGKPGFVPPAGGKRVELRSYAPGRPVPLGPFVVEAVSLPHDAPHVAIRVSAGGRRFAIATDLGHAPRDVRAILAGCDLVMLESNHCPRLLETGPYPLRLKRRVGGSLGHLSNEQTADIAASLEGTRVARLLLCHVSRTNNTPERALEVVSSRVRRLPVEVLPHGVPRLFDVATGHWSASAEQLALGF